MNMNFAWFVLAGGLLMHPAIAGENSETRHQAGIAVQQKCCIQCRSRSFHAAGTVRKIDEQNGIVIIFHAPVADLMWPSMTMPFAVEDRALFDKIRVGEKVRFEFVRDAGNGVIVDIN